MENAENQSKQEDKNKGQNHSINPPDNPINTSSHSFSCFENPNSAQPENTKTSNKKLIKNQNLGEEKFGENTGKLENSADLENKPGELNDSFSDINMKSSIIQNNKLYNARELNNQGQFICKKMSIDLDDNASKINIQNKKLLGCNCKNSGCLKRYCECFSRMKYCNQKCQCKNCFNNIKNEKERNEAIRVYMIKSPVSFKKLNIDLNNITCNCKKSNCLKNYCECYQFGLKCNYNCGCVDCKNRNLFEKKLFFVENKCDYKKGESIDKPKISTPKQESDIVNNQSNMINLREEEENINNINNNKIIKPIKKLENNPQFIVNKNIDNNIINNISPLNNRGRFLSFDDASQWSNLNLKKVAISQKNLIIDNFNINQPNDIYNSYHKFQPNYYYNTSFNNNENSNNISMTRKNSAFSAIIK